MPSMSLISGPPYTSVRDATVFLPKSLIIYH
jgi:hypothetical protein